MNEMSVNLGSIKGKAGKYQQLSFTRSPNPPTAVTFRLVHRTRKSFRSCAPHFLRSLAAFSLFAISPIALKGCLKTSLSAHFLS